MINVTLSVSDNQLQSVINLLNDREHLNMTLEQVKSNPKLLHYIIQNGTVEGNELIFIDPFSDWNNDGWCDIHTYI